MYGDITATAKAIEAVRFAVYSAVANQPCHQYASLAVQAFSSSKSSIAGTGIDPEGIDNNPAYYGYFGTAWLRHYTVVLR